MSEVMDASGAPRPCWPVVGRLGIVGDVDGGPAAGRLFFAAIGVDVGWWRKSGFMRLRCG